MKFPYASVIAGIPDSTDFMILYRSMIPVTLIGSKDALVFTGLVDTGSDYTIFPKSAADFLGIELITAAETKAHGFGGHALELYSGNAVIRVADDSDSLEWMTDVYFFDFAAPDQESVVLGNSGFLDYFTAIFDGLECTLTLEPNLELPAIDS